MSNKIKPWRKKDRRHFKPKTKVKKTIRVDFDFDPPRYEVVNGQYVRVR